MKGTCSREKEYNIKRMVVGIAAGRPYHDYFRKCLKHVNILGVILPDPEIDWQQWVLWVRKFYHKSYLYY